MAVAEKQTSELPLSADERAELAVREADIKLARQGDAVAYLRANGCTSDSEIENPQHLVLEPFHVEQVREMTGHFRCKACGQYHLQDPNKLNRNLQLVPVTCPHCGLEDCCGPRKLFDEAAPGSGKSEILVHIIAFLLGYERLHGRATVADLVCGNKEDARSRVASIRQVMSRPAHRRIFGASATPGGMANRDYLRLKSNANRNAVTAWGVVGFSAGHHNGILAFDDICTFNTSFIKPKEGDNIIEKMKNTGLRSVKTGSAILYLTNTWKNGDATDVMRRIAEANPTDWTIVRRFCGGPPDFRSIAPLVLTRKILEDQWAIDERVFRRGYMGEQVSEEERTFRDPKFWMWAANVPAGQRAPAGVELEVTTPELQSDWTIVAGLDPGFTGEGPRVMTKGRSKSGFVILGFNPRNAKVYCLFADSRLTEPGMHEVWLTPLYSEYHVGLLKCEEGGAQGTLAMNLRNMGLNVRGDNPTRFGSKTFRKADLAHAVNTGRFLIRGVCNQGQVQPYSHQAKLVRAFEAMPLVLPPDILDAAEIAYRGIMELCGLHIAEARKAELEREPNPIYDFLMRQSHPDPEEPDNFDRMFGGRQVVVSESLHWKGN